MSGNRHDPNTKRKRSLLSGRVSFLIRGPMLWEGALNHSLPLGIARRTVGTTHALHMAQDLWEPCTPPAAS